MTRRTRGDEGVSLVWDVSAGQRLLIAAVLGGLAGLAAAWFAPWQLTILAAWGVAGTSFVVWAWASVGRFSPDQTRAFATREDDSRVGTQLSLVSASVASLLGVGFDLVKANQSSGIDAVLLTVVGVLTVAVSWAVVHTTFALRYAHEFYTAPIGGIDFKNSGDPPDYQDFAYVAFTVGMTFQVSDTDVQAQTIRRTVLRHALLSYLFGAVILAVTINVIASLLQ
jgi:uncharacterized membrane protein